jgi:hypothetical protein
MAAPENSYIYQRGSSPNTRVAISQKNRVISKPFPGTGSPGVERQVGVLSTFDWSESRTIDPVRGVGFGDKIQELVPGVTEPMTLTLNRTLLYTAGIAQEVGYRGGIDGLVRSLRQHKWPFDIKSELVFSELATAAALSGQSPALGDPGYKAEGFGGNIGLITLYQACWLNSISASFPSDSAIVAEDASATCTDVTDGTHGYGSTENDYGDLLDAGNNPLLNLNLGSTMYSGLAP